MPRTPMSPRRKPPGNAHNSETAQSIPPPLVGGGEGVFEPGTWVTDLSGHMGDTLCMGGEVAHAVGREQRDGREVAFIVSWRNGEGTVAELSRQSQISRKTAYKMIDRFETLGWEGLQDLSRAPHHHPNAVSAA